jgi:hypothetical protein
VWTYLPAGWQPYAMGRGGDVAVCSAPDADGARQVQVLNVDAGAGTPAFGSALTVTRAGISYSVQPDALCGGRSEAVHWIDDKGRLLT